MRRNAKLLLAALVLSPIASLADATVTPAPTPSLRVQLELASVPDGTTTNVKSDVGLAGGVEGAPFPARWKPLFNLSECTRHRRASYTGDDQDDSGQSAEIVNVGGRDYLDEASLSAAPDGTLKVEAHTRRRVELVATLLPASATPIEVWAYRDGSPPLSHLHVGAFVDFGRATRTTSSFGCRWMTLDVAESGGARTLVSDPRMSAAVASTQPSAPAPHEPAYPEFLISTSISRSSSDVAPLVLLRLQAQ